jgi:hypothetical protein
MKLMGVTRVPTEDEGFYPLQGLPVWKIQFGRWNWCSPLMTVHHIHQADISQLHVFEKWLKESKV